MDPTVKEIVGQVDKDFQNDPLWQKMKERPDFDEILMKTTEKYLRSFIFGEPFAHSMNPSIISGEFMSKHKDKSWTFK